MINLRNPAEKKGFTLIGVVLFIVAIGIVAFIAGTVGVKLQTIGEERKTVNRMNVIRDALKNYYRGHQELPAPAGTPPNDTEVPVKALNLEQKYRLDHKGQYYYYNRVTKPEENCGCPTDTITDIIALTVEGRDVAGVIVSGGPNQTIEPGTVSGTTYTAIGDDVVVSINLQTEAREIALQELRILAKKAWAHDCTCPPSPMPLSLSQLISRFSLSEQLWHDPWGACYAEDFGGIMPRFVSKGPDGIINTADDVKVERLKKCCDEKPPGGSTKPLHYWDFDDDGDPGLFLAGDASQKDDEEGGYGMEFDGDGDYAIVGDDGGSGGEHLFSFNKDDPFSIVVWIKTDTGGTIVSKMEDTTYTPGYRVGINGSDQVYFQINDDQNSSISAHGTTDVADGDCHHIAVTYDGSGENTGLAVYVDGNSETTGATGSDLVGSIRNNVPFQISGYDGNHDLFTGIIDEVAIYDVVLGSTEIQSIHYEGWPFCPPLAYTYRLSAGVSARQNNYRRPIICRLFHRFGTNQKRNLPDEQKTCRAKSTLLSFYVRGGQ